MPGVPLCPQPGRAHAVPAQGRCRHRARAAQGAAFCGNKGALCAALGATRLHRPGSHGSGVPGASLGLCSGGAGKERLWGQAQQTPPNKKTTQRTPTSEQPLEIHPVTGRGPNTRCVQEKKKKTQPKTPRLIFRLPCASRRAGARGEAAGQGWPHPGKKKGIFGLLSLLFLVKVGHALTSGALPCLATARSQQKRKPQAREAAPSSEAVTRAERGTRGLGQPGRAAGPGAGAGQPPVGDAGLAAAGAVGAGAGR